MMTISSESSSLLFRKMAQMPVLLTFALLTAQEQLMPLSMQYHFPTVISFSEFARDTPNINCPPHHSPSDH